MIIGTSTPLVSVVIPCYNSGKFVRKTIESICSQSFTDFELIIVNDGSTDTTLEIAKKFEARDSRVRVITCENSGVALAFQRGIGEARGRFICRIDADDLACKHRLATQVGILEENSSYSAVGSWVRRFKNEHLVGRVCRYPCDPRSLRFFMAFGSQMVNPSIMLRREIVADRILPNHQIAEDLALWLELLSEGKQLANAPDVLTEYRVHPNQASFLLRSEGGGVVEQLYESHWNNLISSGIPSDVLNAGKLLRGHKLNNVDLSATIRSYLPEILSVVNNKERAAISEVIFRLHFACNEIPILKLNYFIKDLNYLKLPLHPFRFTMAAILKILNG